MNNIKPTVLSGWDAVYIRDNSTIERTLDEYVIGVRRTTRRNILRDQGGEELSKWVYSAATGPQETVFTKELVLLGTELSATYIEAFNRWRVNDESSEPSHPF